MPLHPAISQPAASRLRANPNRTAQGLLPARVPASPGIRLCPRRRGPARHLNPPDPAGSFERFIGILIEHYAGKLPLWLAPRQVVVATITSDADGYARDVHAALETAGLRADLDLRNEKIGYQVREHSLAKVPVLLVVGRREAEKRQVAVRRLGEPVEVFGYNELVGAFAARK